MFFSSVGSLDVIWVMMYFDLGKSIRCSPTSVF